MAGHRRAHDSEPDEADARSVRNGGHQPIVYDPARVRKRPVGAARSEQIELGAWHPARNSLVLGAARRHACRPGDQDARHRVAVGLRRRFGALGGGLLGVGRRRRE